MSSFVRNVRTNGQDLQLRVEQNGTEWQIDTGEGPRRASVLEVEPGVYSVLLEGRSWEIRLSDADVTIDDPREPRKSGTVAGLEGRQTVAAPMPGKVIRVLVAEGDSVERGQGLVVIEAMKMQNELKSPKAGRVVSIQTGNGAAVGAGEILAIVE